MDSKNLNEVLSSIVDDDFKNAIKALATCRAFMKAGYSIDEILSDHLYCVCRSYMDYYEDLKNGNY